MTTRLEKNKEAAKKIVKEKRKKVSKRFIIIFLLITISIVSVFLEGRLIEPYSIKVQEKKVVDSNLPTNFHGLKIVQISDLLYSSDSNEKILEKIKGEVNQLDADLIVFTGGMFLEASVSEEYARLLTAFFKDLKANIGKYATLSETDKNNKYFAKIMEEANFVVLDNASKEIYYKESTAIKVIGITSNKYDVTVFDDHFFQILIINNPELISNLKNNVNVILAGYNLGGIINVPYLKNLFIKNDYILDYYEIDQSKMYISNGLGSQKFRFRLFNKPTINLYRLTSY